MTYVARFSKVSEIFETDENNFSLNALEIFLYQSKYVEVYKKYIQTLGIHPLEVKSIEEIPFLPISFFKTEKIISAGENYELKFTSSSTTGKGFSTHYIANKKLYYQSFQKCFEIFYGDIKNYCILALLPSYLEREGSSLVYMVQQMMGISQNEHNGFYINNFEELKNKIEFLESKKQKTLLIGVAFALVDFSKKYNIKLYYTSVMETGGMKGRTKEITRNELHEIISEKFSVSAIHSEYGMTELLSQAYSKKEGKFFSPPWMKILIRDAADPFSYLKKNQFGAVNIIDLANIYSCSFIATDDVGKLNGDGSFEIAGRLDSSDIRGCSLMYI